MNTSSKFIVRYSKFRHVYGVAYKKEQCYDNLKISKIDANSNQLVKVNEKYLSVPWQSSGGGAFAIIPLNHVGRLPSNYYGVVSEYHTGPVLDTEFSPFHTHTIVSASEDANIRVWNLKGFGYSSEETSKKWNEPVATLSGHSKKVFFFLSLFNIVLY